MKTIETKEIVSFIEDNSSRIVGNIGIGNIYESRLLRYSFRTFNNVHNKYAFQSLYCRYYGLNKFKLTREFKKEYFSILEEYRNRDFDFSDVLPRLYVISNAKGLNASQFSLTTRMLNMLDKTMPVYNNRMIKIFGFSRVSAPSFDEKVKIYMNQYEEIIDTYDEIIDKNLLPKTSLYFERRFKREKIGKRVRLNFIFQSAGKLKNKLSPENEGLI